MARTLADREAARESASGFDQGAVAFDEVSRLFVHVFGKSGDNRGATANYLRFIEGGSGFGEPANWKIRTDLFASPALLVAYHGMSQGIIVDGVDIYEMTATKLPRRAHVLTHYESPSENQTNGEIRAGDPNKFFTVRY